MTPLDHSRRAELLASLAAVRTRISDTCAAAGRDTRSVTLVAVTKTYPAADVQTLVELGVVDVAESRDQEARAKIAEIDALAPPGSVRPRWHFVGRLQSRKARAVAGYAGAVHSLDRLELVTGLADSVIRAERAPLDVFVQVSLDGDPERGGVPAAGIAALAEAVATTPGLALRGLMAVAPIDADPEAAYAELAARSSVLRREHPEADAISAGMSADFEAAIRHGATHVRVGTALLGRRSPIVG